jgi:hypothetical protein
MRTAELPFPSPRKGRITRKHGLSYRPEYRAWQTMRLRCTVPTNPAWKDYGGRGISVCDRWRDDVAAFVADMGPKPSRKHELDRIDNDRGYEPGNCRWVLRKTNCRNRRSSKWIEFRGARRLFVELCDEFGIRADTAKHRMEELGWDAERTFTTPVRPKSPKGHAKPPPPRIRPPARSGIRNIHWNSTKQRWRVRACVNGQRLELGTFATIEEAVEAQRRANLVSGASAAEAG